MKRRAIYQLSVDLFMDVLNGRVKLDLPQDSEILRVNVDHLRAMVELLVRSDSFDEVGEGVYPPTRLDLRVMANQG